MATLKFHSLAGTLEQKIPQTSSNPRNLSSACFESNNKGEKKVWRMRMKAMGGAARYKGTQIREKQLTEMIEKKVTEAKEVCEGDATSDECKVAWDEVEEVSQAKADLRLRIEVEKKDPLEFFCQENPETKECRMYED